MQTSISVGIVVFFVTIKTLTKKTTEKLSPMRKSPMIFSSLKVPVFNSNCTWSQSLAFTCFSCGISEQNMRFFCVK